MVWTILLGLLLVVHGLLHLLFVSPVPPVKSGAPVWPFSLTQSWTGLSASVLKPLGLTLMTVAAVGYIALAFAVFHWGVPVSFVKPLAIVASVASILLMGIFWNNGFFIGISLSVAIMVYFLGFFSK